MPKVFTVAFTVRLDDGTPIVTKIVTYPDGQVEITSAPVLKVGKFTLFPSYMYKTEIFDINFLAIASSNIVEVFYINSFDAEPITSDKILFLKEIMKNVRKKFSKKGRWQATVKALGGIGRSLRLTVIHKKLHEKPVTEEEKFLNVRMSPNSVKLDGSIKFFQYSLSINVSEIKE